MTSSAAAGAAHLLRRLLMTVAALALLTHGGVELAPRLVAGGASVAPAAAATSTAGRAASTGAPAASQPVEHASTLRLALSTAAAAAGSDVATPPAPTAFARLGRASGQVVGSQAAHVVSPANASSGRAPPGAAGT